MLQKLAYCFFRSLQCIIFLTGCTTAAIREVFRNILPGI